MTDLLKCPICDKLLQPDDLCASDIEMGACHAECLEGSPVVDLDTGEERPDDKADTFRAREIMEPGRQQRDKFESAVVKRLQESGFLEVEIRKECLSRVDQGYQDEVINAGWHYWNEALWQNVPLVDPGFGQGPDGLDFATPDEVFDKGPEAVRDWQKAASGTDYLGFAVEHIVWRDRRATIVDRDFPIGTPVTSATRYTPPPSSHLAGWQDISTAPKNTKVLAAYRNELGNWRIVTACYHTQLDWSDEYGDHEQEYAPEDWYEESDSSEVIYPCSKTPTLWMPLPHPEAAPVQLVAPVATVKTMRLGDGRADYYVSIKVGNREVTPHVFREEFKAAYHVALYNWLLNGTEKPDLMAFDEGDWPAQATETIADVEGEIARVVQSVNEWDDRTSPDDYPEHLLITSEELADLLRNFAGTLEGSDNG